jgi:hypothetical protein
MAVANGHRYDPVAVGATATLGLKATTVEPGGEATCEIRIRNSGSVVDQFTLEVLGDSAAWAIVEPAQVSLFPGAESVARIRFKPPKSPSIPARAIPFAVRVKSREDAKASMVEEGVIEVGGFHETTAEIIPRTAKGAARARAQLALDNRGNVRINARLTATDPDRKLNFAITPPGLVAEPGTASFAQIRLTPRQRFFTGPPKTLPYKVFVHQDGQPPIAVDGTVQQTGLLPTWLVPALIGLVALALVLAVLWFLVLKPTIASTAKDAVNSPVSAAKSAAAQANLAAQLAAANKPGGVATGGAAGQNPLGGLPTSDRIGLNTDYPVQGGTTISDLIFENPNGDAGAIKLQRFDPKTNTTTDLLTIRLENFRDLDFHFVSPIIITQDQHLKLVAASTCTPGAGQTGCTASVTYSGYQKPLQPTPSPS